jgi:formylmethanofuran dehydrogenase subunit E
MGALIDRVIELIKEDIAYGDVTSIEGLLENVPENALVDFLPEEEQVDYENKFMCNKCHEHFHAADMDFDVNESDLCKNCNYVSLFG